MTTTKTTLSAAKAALLAMAAALMMTFSACTPMDCIDKVIDTKDKSIASSEVCTYPAAFAGVVPAAVMNAFSKRFPNQSSVITADTKVVIFHMNDHNLVDVAGLKEVYDHGGIIVVIDHDPAALAVWAEKHGFVQALCTPKQIGGDKMQELYAFNNRNNHYILDFIPEDLAYNEFLNFFISWVNEHLAPPSILSNTDSKDIRNIFDYQSIDHTFNLSLDKQESKAILSSADWITKKGTINVKTMIYPLFAFEDQLGHGDYYIVSQTIVALNRQMYGGKWTNTHGGVHVRLCGFYMTNLRTQSTILYTDYKPVETATFAPVFANSTNPSPTTAIGSTTYTSGFTWSLGASLTGGINSGNGTFTGSINGGASFSNTSSRSIANLDVQNISKGSVVSYNYPFNNLPIYDVGDISITDPPSIAVSDAEFHQDWIWHVPQTKSSGNWQFVLETAIYPQYGSCHFFSTGADFRTNTWDDAVQGNSYFRYQMTQPNRVPTGTLNITNSVDGAYFSDVQIWKSETSVTLKPDYVIDGSFASGQTATKILPVDTYRIEFKAGSNAASSTRYHLETPVAIVRGETRQLNYNFNFIAGGYK